MPDELAGRSVRCARRAGTVRTPDTADGVPFAQLAPQPEAGAADGSEGEETAAWADDRLHHYADAGAVDTLEHPPADRATLAEAADPGAAGDPTYPIPDLTSDPAGDDIRTDVTPVAAAVLPLNYADPRAPRRLRPRGEPSEVVAERLMRVEATPEGDPSTMSECPHCGSTIASFVRKCPFCRHPLFGP